MKSRQQAEKKGRFAEIISCLFLRLKGYRILKRRFRTYVGEIDIIAQKRKRIFFIEVKYRHHVRKALQAIHPSQIKRIQRAALVFEAFYPHYVLFDKQVDVMLCARMKLPVHIKNVVRMV